MIYICADTGEENGIDCKSTGATNIKLWIILERVCLLLYKKHAYTAHFGPTV